MNQDRQRRLLAKKEMKKPVSKFEEIDLKKASFVPNGMTRSFKNNRYIVMIYDDSKTTHGKATSVLVQKLDNTPILGHWKEMQKIKNEIFGTETTAVEYYPKESELIDDHNIYWFWIFPDNILPIPII